MNIVAIDPSKNTVGVARCIYDFAKKQECKWDWWLVNPKGKDIIERSMYIVKFLKKKIQEIDVIILEYPTFFGSTKGAVAATQGYTLDLACICGAITGAFHPHALIVYYLPHEWKGNRPKSAIEFRFKKKFNTDNPPSEHEQEAAMMLCHYLNRQ